MLKVFVPEDQLGIKTIFFTIIGPLINPAGAKNHMMGVYKPELVSMVGEVIAEMDFNHVIVAHGLDGLDEISIVGKTSIAEIKNGKIKKYEIAPEDFGIRRCSLEDLAGGAPEYNAQIIRDIFSTSWPRVSLVGLGVSGRTARMASIGFLTIGWFSKSGAATPLGSIATTHPGNNRF